LSADGLAGTDLFRIDPEMVALLDDMSDEELGSFAELHDDPMGDEQIELYIFVYFYLSTRTFSAKYMEQAILQTEGWLAVTGLDDPNRARRFQILDMVLATMCRFADLAQEVQSIAIDEG
jgi:hypothetical protein